MSMVEKRILKPDEYHDQISALTIEDFEIRTSSIFEAKTTLVKIQRIEDSLKEIRRNVSADIRAIELYYLDPNNAKKSILGSSAFECHPKLQLKENY